MGRAGMKPAEIEASNRHYAQNLARLRDPAQVCDWGGPGSQRARFRVLAAVGDLAGRSVLDVGCGLGALSEWFAETGLEVDYTGIDLCPDIVAAARVRSPRGRFEVRDLLADLPSERWDWVLSSGIFNRVYEDNHGFVERMLGAIFASCRLGIAANFITTWADPGSIGPETFQVEPAWLLGRARALSRRVAFRHDYLPHDGTIYVYRDGAP